MKPVWYCGLSNTIQHDEGPCWDNIHGGDNHDPAGFACGARYLVPKDKVLDDKTETYTDERGQVGTVRVLIVEDTDA